MTRQISGREGAIRESTGSFSQKEKAIEDQWARQSDAEKIRQLREQLETTKKQLEEQHSKLAQLERNHKQK
ncbi:uncharacterized protein VTP21DRAFT_9801 [Calcarisporiella thermophila]|uniref:uncharacterized protein n=1 Tax=Calcarisporiella thermophila TaxID=911321 RepID=UPI003743262E